jgi:hypothetical protein
MSGAVAVCGGAALVAGGGVVPQGVLATATPSIFSPQVVWFGARQWPAGIYEVRWVEGMACYNYTTSRSLWGLAFFPNTVGGLRPDLFNGLDIYFTDGQQLTHWPWTKVRHATEAAALEVARVQFCRFRHGGGRIGVFLNDIRPTDGNNGYADNGWGTRPLVMQLTLGCGTPNAFEEPQNPWFSV